VDSWELWVRQMVDAPWCLVGTKEEEMKIGTRLVSRKSGENYEVIDIHHAVDGTPLHNLAWIRDDGTLRPKNTWLDEGTIYARYHILDDVEKRIETLEIGDIAIGKYSGARYEVVRMENDKPIFYRHENKEIMKWNACRELIHPARHRFYVKNHALYVDPPLEIIDGIHDALELSIRKWEVVAEESPVRSGLASSTCAFCHVYENDCKGCPVMARTGKDQCRGTPYYGYAGAPTPANAQKMVDFLKSLREATLKVGTVFRGESTGSPYMLTEIQGGGYILKNLSTGMTEPEMTMSQVLDYHTVVSRVFYINNGTLCVEPALTGKEPDPLGLSIEKWETIVQEMERGVEVTGDGGATTCALCRSVTPENNVIAQCQNCSVFRFTQERDCEGTPYTWWKTSKSLAVAKAELAFLRELRGEA